MKKTKKMVMMMMMITTTKKKKREEGRKESETKSEKRERWRESVCVREIGSERDRERRRRTTTTTTTTTREGTSACARLFCLHVHAYLLMGPVHGVHASAPAAECPLLDR